MTRKWLVCILALAAGALVPPGATGQVAPDRAPRASAAGPAFKYQVYAGFAYTSLNQVNQSRHGLIGFDVAVSRNWGRYFALAADGAYYPSSYASGNPGNPTVSSVLFGPELHAPLYGKTSGFFRGWLGGEHTGGESMTPRVSFAGGLGVGLEYAVKPRWVIRVSGDDILSSFSVTNNSPELGNSPHMHANARASVGVGYRF